MKKSVYIFFVIMVFTMFTTCDDKLDVQPVDGISPEEVFSSESNLLAFLVGMYTELREYASYGGGNQMINDFLGFTDEVIYTGNLQDLRDFLSKAVSTDNGRNQFLWFNYYQVINNVNLFLDHADIIQNDPDHPNKHNTAIGEAKLLRGLSYFELIQLFAQPYEPGGANSHLGVPLRLQGITDYGVDHSLERSSVGEIYDQIVLDLTDAYNLLPKDNGDFGDKYAAAAYLARVYLQQGRYDEARDMAHDVIVNSGHGLNPTYEQAFNNESNTPEDLFNLQISAIDGYLYLIGIYASKDDGGDGSTALSNSYFNIFDDPVNDARANFYHTESTSNSLYTSKFLNINANIPIIRFAEMYLIRAEANYRLNTTTGQTPLEDINKLRMRAGATPLTSVDLNDIWLERRRELSFEGRLIQDFKRFQRPVGNLPYDSPKLVLPIPLNEMNTNTLMVQNPGY